MKLHNIILVMSIILINGCAVQKPPSGGGTDQLGPHIIECIPVDKSINVNQKQSIKIIFDKMIDFSFDKETFNVYPYTDITAKAYGNTIEIKPRDVWPQGTFKIIGSRKITDYYNNKMAKPIALTFSTNEVMPLGSIAGKLMNFDPKKVYQIGLYINNKKRKTINLIYCTQNNNEGEFIFNNILNDKYIIIATESIQGEDVLVDISNHRYGFSTKVIKVANDTLYNNIYISDPAHRLKFKSVKSINKYYGKFFFDDGFTEKSFISNIDYFDELLVKDNDFFKLFIPEKNDSINISLFLENNIEKYLVSDKIYINKSVKDSIGPIINFNQYNDDTLFVEFSEPTIIESDVNKPFYFNLIENIDYHYLNPREILIYNIPDSLNEIKIKNNLIYDLVGNNFKDTLLNINKVISKNKKQIIGADIYGNIDYIGNNNIIVKLSNNDNSYKVKTNNNEFHFKNIKPGFYEIWAYENINTINDNYFNGSLNPLRYAARFGVYENTVEVRSKWDVEGIEIKIN